MRHPLSNFSLLSIAVLVTLCTASTASAANIAPNPGFEMFCGTATHACSWAERDNQVQFQRDESVAHAGSTGSYKLKMLDAFAGTSLALSDYLPAPPSGAAQMSFWYRTTDARVIAIRMFAFVYDNSTCTPSGSGQLVGTLAPVSDGDWHMLLGSVTTDSGLGMNLGLDFYCASACADAQVNIDDVVFDQSPPTAVVVHSLSAGRARAGVLLRWRTAHEQDLLGFNVYRRLNGKLVKLNRALIPSVFDGIATGHGYSWLDRTAPKGAARYRLQAVRLSGERTWVGSAVVRR
jgi:hypothetical protein